MWIGAWVGPGRETMTAPQPSIAGATVSSSRCGGLVKLDHF